MEKKLFEGNMRRNYLAFAIPLIISALLSQSYGFVNSFMIGKYIGSIAFTATAVTADFLGMINSIFYGYLTGIGICISVYYGKGDYQKMMDLIKLNLPLSSALALIISLICNLFCHQIFDVLNVGDDVYKMAEQYFRIYVCGYLVFQLNWGFTYISSGIGFTGIQLATSVATGVLNVILNYVFLAIFDKEIGYSAISTILSSALTTAIYIFVFTRFFKHKKTNRKSRVTTAELFRLSMDYGTPSMLQQIAMYSCTAMVSPLTNTCTTAAIAGYAIANKARELIMTVYGNAVKANTSFVAQVIGAGRTEKLKEGIKIGIAYALLFFIITASIFIIFAKEFMLLFLDPVKDEESFQIGVNIIRFLFPFLVFNVFNNLFHGIFRATGSGKLMVASTLIYAVSYVIYAYTLFAILPTDLKIYGAYISLAAAYITELIFAVIMFARGKCKALSLR